MGIVKKDQLTRAGKVTVGTELVDVDDEGGQVRVRGLTRGEFHDISRRAADDAEEREILITTAGMVDPEMTEAEVREWASKPGAAGEIQDASVAIGRLSRLVKESAKAVTKRAVRRSGR